MNIIPPNLLDEIELDAGYEWIDGLSVEKHMGARSSRVNVRLSKYLDTHVEDNKLGDVFDTDGSYQLPKQTKIRKPDLSFVAKGRLTKGVPGGHLKLAPDLSVEVVSPNDLAEEIAQKVSDFLAAGTRLIWVLYPETRIVWVFRADGSAAWLSEQQELSGEDVVPGFRCAIAPLFAGLEEVE